MNEPIHFQNPSDGHPMLLVLAHDDGKPEVKVAEPGEYTPLETESAEGDAREMTLLIREIGITDLAGAARFLAKHCGVTL